ncbi:ATP-binding protein [Cytobacillus massiliigabonensis]|uniref:ATP-binding protein n=1 Tax=Cytobacillus massiliigabonensis TaxID=1871011 RepID=UPI000C85DF99|nr:ATP-binding protein [Cytobacillus massiliigabonensis]
MKDSNKQFLEKDNNMIIDSEKLLETSIYPQYLENINALAAGIAHEIRNPLTSVKGFLQLLRPYLIDSGKEQYIDIALDELDRANNLIFEYLNAAKPQKNKKEEISLLKIIHEIGLLYESEALFHNINLNIQLPDHIPSVFADGAQLKQVFVNLLKNAIDAIIEDKEKIPGKIDILLEIEDLSAVCIYITDNGCGMTNATLNHLFTPFYTTKNSGTGIGLPICKKIIEEHSGQIFITSELGKGSTFKIVLPIHKNL